MQGDPQEGGDDAQPYDHAHDPQVLRGIRAPLVKGCCLTGWISAGGQPLVKTAWMVMVLFMDTMPSLFHVSPYSDRST